MSAPPVPVSLYAQNNGTAYPMQCDANGNLYTAPLAESGVPVILAPNGTVATSGVVTFGTALPLTFPYAWVRLPAGAVVGGAAGLYYATCTSATVCQIYTNFVDPSTTAFTPSVPASPVAAIGSNAAYTQTTATQLVLLNTTIPAKAMGAYGSIRKTILAAIPTNANAKTIGMGLSGGVIVTSAQTTATGWRGLLQIYNAGDTSHQLTNNPASGWGGFTGTPSYSTLDTTQAQALVVTGQLAVATDYLVIVTNLDEIFPRQ